MAAAGAVRFEALASFTKNKAEGAGQGGAVANFGSLVFQGVSAYESRAHPVGNVWPTKCNAYRDMRLEACATS